MEYPIKKLLFISEDKEPEFYGEPVEGSAHIEYLRDYIIDNYSPNDKIHGVRRAGEPRDMAVILSNFKNVIISMNDVDVKRHEYLPTCILSVPEDMSETLQEKFREMIPFFEQFKFISAYRQKRVEYPDGLSYLTYDLIETNPELSVEDQINGIIDSFSKKKTVKK